jgi:hypothetical protein
MSDDVVDLKDYKNKVKEEKETDFEEIMRKNAENKAREKKDREKANRNVKRSYRLKGKDEKN